MNGWIMEQKLIGFSLKSQERNTSCKNLEQDTIFLSQVVIIIEMK